MSVETAGLRMLAANWMDRGRDRAVSSAAAPQRARV